MAVPVDPHTIAASLPRRDMTREQVLAAYGAIGKKKFVFSIHPSSISSLF
jgi:hypothetical protein